MNLKATATDTVRVTFDFGLRLITSVLESFSVGAAVDNSLRINVESSGKISYKMEQLLYHWQKNKAIWKWIPTGTFVQIPLIFTPRVNIYAVAEASAEYTINGELLNTHQHFDVAKQYTANTGWSDYSIPPTLHPDAQLAYGVKGTLQAGLKVKAGVFFYDQDARDPKNPNEDGETEETLDVVVEATKGISGECTSDLKGVTVSQFISVKPELALKLPIFSRNIEAKLAVAVPNLPLSTSVVNVPFCRPDSNCIAPADSVPTDFYQNYHYYFPQQFRKNSQNRLDTLLYSRLYQPHSDSLPRARLDSFIFLYDSLGRPLRIKASGPGKRDQGFVYSGNKATRGYYDDNGDLITDNQSGVVEFQGNKITRIHESGPETPGYYNITDITYYPNGYVQSVDYRDWDAPSTAGNNRSRLEYTYNPAEGTQEIKYFFTTRDTYDADIFHFEHQLTYKTTFDMTYREQAVVIANLGGSAFADDESILNNQLGVNFEIGKLIHNGTFFEGKLVRLVEQTFILPRFTPEPTSTKGCFFEYTVDERKKPTGFSYYEKLVNEQVVKRNTDRIKWTVCR